MKIKYFRFLYYGRKGCLLHLGEVEDTKSGERVTFLYVSGNDQPGNEALDRAEDAERDISYPEQVDYLIMGEISDGTREVLKEVLRKSRVDTLVYPETGNLEFLPKGHEIRHLVGLAAGTDCCEFRKEAAGWKLHIGSLEENSVVFLHGLSESGKLPDFQKKDSREEDSQEEGISEGAVRFDDCVMNVSFLDGKEHNGWWEEKDWFAAAMRCTLDHDYDVCRRQNAADSGEYLTGTLLYGNTHLGKCLDWMKASGEGVDLGRRIRFLGLPVQGKEELWDGEILDEIPGGHKCYYISAPGKPASLAVNEICQRNPYQVLNVTGEGTGISCAGFLKYAE